MDLGRLLRLGRAHASGGARLVADPPAAKFGLSVPPDLLAALTGRGVAPRVSRAEALQVGAVMRARNLIAGTLATLPLEMIDPGKRSVDWPLFEQPDPDLAKSVTLAYTFEDLLFEGESWWRVIEFGPRGFPLRAQHVPISSVTVGGTADLPSISNLTPDQLEPRDGQIFIDGRPVLDREVIHFVSPNPPLLVHAARSIRTALRLERTVAMYADEPMPQGYFEKREGVDAPEDDQIQGILDDWDEARRRKAWGYIGGLKPVPLSFNPEQLELLGNRREAVVEIARHAGVDPEDLGVSTTSRTYANIEQRRQDLLTFTLGAYVSAVQDRLSMGDVAPRGHQARFNFGGFLRTDTLGRYASYDVGLRVGAITEDELREKEDRPPLTPAQKARKDALNGVTPAAVPGNGSNGGTPSMSNGGNGHRHFDAPQLVPVKFDADEVVRVQFDTDEVAETFKVDVQRRTITGLAVPWGKVARSGFSKWRFAPDSLQWSDVTHVKLNLHHDFTQLVGRATRMNSGSRGLMATFVVAKGAEGDRALALADDKILDGFSIEVDFDDSKGDSWQPDPSDESVRLVRQGTLRGVALTGMPAFDDARVTAVHATRKGAGAMPEDKKPDGGEGAQFDLDGHLEKFAESMVETQKKAIADLTESVSEGLKSGVQAALENIHDPQKDGPIPVRPARARITREAPVYTLNGAGPTLVRDAWMARMHGDKEAFERLYRYQEQTADVAQVVQSKLQFATNRLRFGADTTTAAEVIPPGYRPDLFVPQLAQGRPFVNALSRGTIANGTPFVVPTFGSATGATGDHTEGIDPTDGSLTFDSKTVTPGAISGLLQLTREIVDSSNPAIDQIALNAMRESYARQTEQKVYQLLNGVDGQGGVIAPAPAVPPAGGLVPSGAQVWATGATPDGRTIVSTVRQAMADYQFLRFADPNTGLLSRRATSGFATAVDTTERPLLPSVGAQNAVGLGSSLTQGWFIDGLPFVPAWAISGTGDGDGDVFILNSMDAWAFESPTLVFRYEERSGPTHIDLSLFGYFAVHLLRPVGLLSIRASDGIV